MSWWAHLTDERGDVDLDWNFTHNTSRMIYAALEDQGVELPIETERYGRPLALEDQRPVPWWMHLDGMAGNDGARYLGTIIRGLERTPERFRAMNPANGWGDYDTLLDVLQEMHRSVPEWPARWSASG